MNRVVAVGVGADTDGARPVSSSTSASASSSCSGRVDVRSGNQAVVTELLHRDRRSGEDTTIARARHVEPGDSDVGRERVDVDELTLHIVHERGKRRRLFGNGGAAVQGPPSRRSMVDDDRVERVIPRLPVAPEPVWRQPELPSGKRPLAFGAAELTLRPQVDEEHHGGAQLVTGKRVNLLQQTCGVSLRHTDALIVDAVYGLATADRCDRLDRVPRACGKEPLDLAQVGGLQPLHGTRVARVHRRDPRLEVRGREIGPDATAVGDRRRVRGCRNSGSHPAQPNADQ